MKQVKRIMLILVATLVLCLASVTGSFAANDFIIRDYAVNMTVSEDNTYQITETVKVEFTAPSHGIYVNIPLRTALNRDGQKSQYTAKVTDFNWISGEAPAEDIRCRVRVRYKQKEQWATVHPTGKDAAEITFDEPQRAITPGQSAVLYDDDIVLGGGIIE